MPIIIDGHNLLWTVRESDEDHDSPGDLQLCHIIARYLRIVAEKGHIVFDGTGPPDIRAFDNINNLEVSFSGINSDADSVIEKKVAASTDPRRLVVVSSDRRLRIAARAAKASAVKADVFWKDVNRRLNQSRRTREPGEKRHGLSEGETDRWLEIFGME
jgi:predicted RNA-binding protein with PIN domain